MVTANLLGGLGNYMFQITAAYGLALDNGDEAIFNINDSQCGHKHLTSYMDNIFRNLRFVSHPLPIHHTYGEPTFTYTPITYKPNTKLHGYYQSEKYFIKWREKILDLYRVDETTKEYIEKKYNDILNRDLCSLHVRRGDYLGLPNHHPVCSIEYYKKAMSEIPSGSLFLVFSDDIRWCKEIFTEKNIVFIEGNKDYEDMYLMSMCENNIIANSSFSWWGSWLNENVDKKVIAPKKWFGSANQHNTKDLIPLTWKMI